MRLSFSVNKYIFFFSGIRLISLSTLRHTQYEYNLFYHWRRTCRDLNELMPIEEPNVMDVNAFVNSSMKLYRRKLKFVTLVRSSSNGSIVCGRRNIVMCSLMEEETRQLVSSHLYRIRFWLRLGLRHEFWIRKYHYFIFQHLIAALLVRIVVLLCWRHTWIDTWQYIVAKRRRISKVFAVNTIAICADSCFVSNSISSSIGATVVRKFRYASKSKLKSALI